LANPPGRPVRPGRAAFPRGRRMDEPRAGPTARGRRPRGRRGRRADWTAHGPAKLPDGRRADRLRAPARSAAQTGRAIRAPRVRYSETPADRRAGPNHRNLAPGAFLPQRPVPLPFLSGSGTARAGQAAVPCHPDRPSPPGKAADLARMVALEGPGAIVVFDVR